VVNDDDITLLLHYRNSPIFLIRKMTKLSAFITKLIIDKKGTLEFINKLSALLWSYPFGYALVVLD
jgi:hypothetical protein